MTEIQESKIPEDIKTVNDVLLWGLRQFGVKTICRKGALYGDEICRCNPTDGEYAYDIVQCIGDLKCRIVRNDLEQ